MSTLEQRGYNPQWLKDTFLLGVDLTLDDGSPYPERLFIDSIEQASKAISDELGIIFEPQVIQERHDKEPDAVGGWYPIRTRHRPLINVEKLSILYGNSQTKAELPPSWAMVTESLAGQIHIIPTTEGASSYMISGGLPVILGLGSFGAPSYVPAYFELEYEAGFPFYKGQITIPAGQTSIVINTPYTFKDEYKVKTNNSLVDITKKRFDTFTIECPVQNQDLLVEWYIDTLPSDIIQAIGLKACLLALDVAGDLIAGAGIGSISTSLDGLSQNINTTSSATNSGYGARVIQFTKELKALMATLKANYRAMNILAL